MNFYHDAPENFEILRLRNQICFPMYACSRDLIKRYKPYLDQIDLTYTQYIAMLILWERKTVTAKELGHSLFLDSGTLTPLLKRMEAKGLLIRRRDPSDERSLLVTVTPAGEALKEQALIVPREMAKHTNLTEEETDTLYRLLYKLLRNAKTKEILGEPAGVMEA